jgi:glyoxylase-like metal-dependent hydrolase (beta-lactamase superfamily II)
MVESRTESVKGGGMEVATTWFSVEDARDGISRIWEPYADPMIQANAWLIQGRNADLVVDACNGLAPLLPFVQGLRRTPERALTAVMTHAHMDHAGGLHEFDVRSGHAEEEPDLKAIDPLLLAGQVWPAAARQMEEAGFPLPEILIDRLPADGFDPSSWRPTGTTITDFVDEGDVIDLGDRRLEVLLLPGHTRGSIGLWDVANRVLFSGDAVYAEEPLIDTAPTSDVSSYLETMRRLRRLPAAVVHPGHDYSFDRDTLVRVADRYLERRGGAR